MPAVRDRKKIALFGSFKDYQDSKKRPEPSQNAPVNFNALPFSQLGTQNKTGKDAKMTAK